jgi:hypothetical protein
LTTSLDFHDNRYTVVVVERKKHLMVGSLNNDVLEEFLNLDSKLQVKDVEGANLAENLDMSEHLINQILKDFQQIHQKFPVATGVYKLWQLGKK